MCFLCAAALLISEIIYWVTLQIMGVGTPLITAYRFLTSIKSVRSLFLHVIHICRLTQVPINGFKKRDFRPQC